MQNSTRAITSIILRISFLRCTDFKSSVYGCGQFFCVICIAGDAVERGYNYRRRVAGIEPAAKYFSKECIAMLSMARQGVGVAILPELILKLFPGGFEYRRLDPPVARTLGIGVRDRKNCGPLSRFIIRYLTENCRQ